MFSIRYYGKRECVLASTNGIAFEIYVAGCKGYCEGCHSPHVWNFNQGRLMDNEFYDELIEYMKSKEWQFDNIVLIGGEPLDNKKEDIINFCNVMKDNFENKDLYLYTHFELEEIDEEIKQCFNYIKTGKFDKNKYSDEYYSNGINLKSINQKMNKKGEDY